MGQGLEMSRRDVVARVVWRRHWCRRWRRRASVTFATAFAAVLAQIVTIPCLVAQQTPGAHPSVDSAAALAAARGRTPIDSVKVMRLAAIADTGRMTPGYRDISRYDTPGYCLAAVRGVREETWRRNEQINVVEGSAEDTLPTAAIALGRRCLAALPDVGHVAPVELPNLFLLAMLVGDSVRMEAALTRAAALAPTVEARGYIYSDAIEQLAGTAFPPLVAHPRELALANAFAARLDALGADARIPRFAAHTALRNVAEGPQFDTTALLREDKALRNVMALFTPDDRKEHQDELAVSMDDSLIVVWYQHRPNLPEVVHGIMDRYFASVGRQFSPDQVSMITGYVVGLASKVGQPAPPITGKYWYPETAPHVQPTLGKVTLVMRMEKGGGLMNGQTAMLKRLYDRYHDRGLEIVLVFKTEGFSWSSPPQSSSDEAKTIAWYYYEHLKLPFKIVVDETPFTVRPDGRKVPGPIDFERQYFPPEALIGRDGKIYTTWIGLVSESQMNAFIEQALGAKM
jgi:hypothetical protein